MTQTWAIFLDAYRSLNAKKMFWIVLVLSGLAVAAFAFVGIDEQGFKIVHWHFDSQLFNTQTVEPAVFYKFIFSQYGVSLWLAWLATILALVSTAGIFPDLITGGSIAMLVSKPIGRLRLFVLQYLAGLLFVTLQVTVFSLASFLVIGLRGGAWEPSLFMAVPLVVCFFSYLFATCVLVGIVTRSTLAALLLTLLFWFMVFAVGAAENTLLMFRTMNEEGVTLQEMQTPPPKPKERPKDDTKPAGKPPEQEMEQKEDREGEAEERQAEEQADRQDGGEGEEPGEEHGDEASRPDDDRKPSASLRRAHQIVYGIKTVLPKTTETVDLLQRTLISMADLPQPDGQGNEAQARVGRELAEELRSRSVAWIVGTSLGFEFLVLSLAAWVFCRRDY